jgi:hypothetical protein
MEERNYTLIPCDGEWILLSSLTDYNRLHSLASIRAFRTRRDSWEVHPPRGTAYYLYSVDTPLEAAHQYLKSMDMDGDVLVIN